MEEIHYKLFQKKGINFNIRNRLESQSFRRRFHVPRKYSRKYTL